MDPEQYQGLIAAINAVEAAVTLDIDGLCYFLDGLFSAWAFLIGIHVVNS